MFWLGYNGYSNFANIVPLFLLAQIILNSQRNYTKNLINEEVSHIRSEWTYLPGFNITSILIIINFLN